MAIANNPHTYSGILIDSPLLEASDKIPSRMLAFLCSMPLSFGGKKLLRGWILIIFLRTFVLRAFFLGLGWYTLGCVFWSRRTWFFRVCCRRLHLTGFGFRFLRVYVRAGVTGSFAVLV
jgi:hypothetical protein